MTNRPRSWPTLQALGDVLSGLTDALPLEAGDPASVRVVVSAIDVAVPLEMRIEDGAELRVSFPRGRLATGFDPPHGRLVAHLDVTALVTGGTLR